MIVAWKDPRRFKYGLIALFPLVVAALAAFYIERQVREFGARFTERAEFFALAFADRAALYLSQDKQDELRLLAQAIARSSGQMDCRSACIRVPSVHIESLLLRQSQSVGTCAQQATISFAAFG